MAEQRAHAHLQWFHAYCFSELDVYVFLDSMQENLRWKTRLYMTMSDRQKRIRWMFLVFSRDRRNARMNRLAIT